MLKEKKIVLFLIILMFTFGLSRAQTAGSGTLLTIESLAKQEASNSEKIGELNRKHRDTYVSEDIKSKRLQDELSELINKKVQNEDAINKKLEDKLREIETSSTWKNRRESAQKGWKEYKPGTCGAGGPPPICPVDHWFRVSVSDAMREYDALVDKELDKIKRDLNKFDNPIENKRREIFDFRSGDNEFSQLRAKIDRDINDLVAKNADLRSRIAELSRKYVSQIESEFESIQNSDIQKVMREIAQKHVAILKIGVLEAKVIALEQEEREAISALNEKLRKQNQEKIDQLNQKVVQKQNKLASEQLKFNNDVNVFNQELKALNAEKNEIERELKKQNLDDEDKQKLTSRQKELTDLIQTLEGKKINATNQFISLKTQTEQEIKTLNDEVWNLKINLPSVIREAENNLKQAFSVKRIILEDALSGRRAKLKSIENSIITERDVFRNKVKKYESLVEPERVRLMRACKSSGASCWGSDVVGNIWQHANKVISCSHDMENNGVLYSNCEDVFAHYNSFYKSLVNGISDSDLGLLMRTNPSRQYNNLIEKLK